MKLNKGTKIPKVVEQALQKARKAYNVARKDDQLKPKRGKFKIV